MMGRARVDEVGAELGEGARTCSGAESGLMAPPAAARATTDCAGMLFMSLSAAAWLQHSMTPPAFARGRLDALGG